MLEDGDSDEIIRALRHIAKAKGMTTIAQETGLGRESLYKALSSGVKPRFDTILKVIRALGIKLHAEARFWVNLNKRHKCPIGFFPMPRSTWL